MSLANRDGWRVVWTAFVVAVFGFGIGFYGPAVYLPALHQARGWSISTISMAITAHYLGGALLIPCLPAVYRRFAVGRIPVAGAVLAGPGALARANPQQARQPAPAPASALRLPPHPRFWTSSAAVALGRFAHLGLFPHLMARLEPDFGAAMAALAISLVTLCAVLGRSALPWLLGERDRRLAAAANLL